jgi:hypothetical protein
MAVNLAPGPFGAGGQFFDANGKMLNAGFINTYAAGTTTPLATYTTSAGNVANSTTITLGVDGRPPNEIWLTAGSSYRFDLLDGLSNLIKTYDNLIGINDTSSIAEWTPTNLTPVFISSTSFSLAGNQTGILPNGIRLKTTNTGGTMYGNVVSGTYSSIPNTTTFVIANDVGSALDSGLSAVSYSIISSTNPSISPDEVGRKATLVTCAAVTDIWSIAGDYVHVTPGGVTTITNFGTALFAGNTRTVVADGAFTLTNGAAIQCVGAVNISSVAGDSFIVRAETTTVAKIVNYSRVSGAPVTHVTHHSRHGWRYRPEQRGEFLRWADRNSGDYWDVVGLRHGDGCRHGNWREHVRKTTRRYNDSSLRQCADRRGKRAIVMTLSGVISSPAGNLRISVKDTSAVTGKILANNTGLSKDSTITAFRIA